MAGLQREIVNERNVPPLRRVFDTNVGSGGYFGITGSAPRRWNVPTRDTRDPSLPDCIFEGQFLSPPEAANIQEFFLIDRAPSRAPSFRERELAWRRAHPEAFADHENEWVVLESEEIIAHGTDASVVIREAKARGIRTPYIFFVEAKSDNSVRIGL
jgi:hypothetical protein